MRAIRCFVICLSALLFLPVAAVESNAAAEHQAVQKKIVLSVTEQAWLQQHPVIRIRISPAYPPFEFFDQGKFQGIEVDYLNILSQRLGVEFRPVLAEVPWAEALERFSNRDGVDMILGITHTAEREAFAVFTDVYVSFPQVVFTRKDIPFVSGVRDLAGMTVSIERGYVMRGWLSRDVPNVRFVDVDRSEDALDAVATGKADAYVGSLAVGSYFIEKGGLTDLKVAAPTPYGADAMAMAVRKDWPELASLINKVLRSLNNEDHRAIRQRWLSLRYEHGLEVKDIVLWSVVVAAAALFWIIPLRIMVKRRTAELEQEVQRRRESEQKARAVFDQTFEFVGMLSPDGTLLEANRTSLDFIGLPAGDVINRPFWETPWWSHAEEMQQKIRKAVASASRGNTVRFEATHRDRSGTLRTIDFTLKPVFDEQGSLLYLIPEGRDITETRQAEEQLRMSEHRYRALFDSAGDAIFLMQGDRFVDCNPRTLEMFGCDREQILGTQPYRFSPPMQPDGRDSKEKALEKIREVMTGAASRFEWRHLKFDGTPFDAEVSLNKIDLAAGAYIQAIVRDVSERKRAEDEIRKSEQKLKLILDHSPYAGYVLGLDGTSIYVNNAAASISGYSREELLGRDLMDLVHPDDLDAMRKRRDARLAGAGVEPTNSFRIIDKSGAVHWVENYVMVLQWEGREALLGYLWDITARKQAEEELQVRAELLDKASDSIFLLDQQGGILYANETACRSRCYGREQMPLLNIRDLVPNDVRDNVASRISEIFAKETVVFESAHVRRDGTVFPVESSVRVMETGGQKYIISSVRDISERKKAEAELRESEERFRGLIEKAPVAISISREGKTLYVNQKYLQVYGFPTSEELVGQPIFDQWAPDTREVVRERAEKRARGEAVPSEYEGTGQRKDGTRFPVHIVVDRVTLPDGPAFIAFLSDISERKRAEEERERLINDIQTALEKISRSQKEWQDTFDSITDMISIHDRDFNVTRANKAFFSFLGLPPDEVIGRKCHELMHHGAASPVASCPHQQTLRDGVPIAEEVVDERTKKTFRVSTYPYHAPDGELVGSIHVSRDVTEEKERELSLIMTERLASLGQMASGIAHEINNPLESVMLCAEMLLMKVAKDRYDHGQFEKYLKTIDEEVIRCRNITSNMLSFSRQTPREQMDVDAQALLEKTIDLVGYQGRLKDVTVAKKFGSGMPVRCNEGELRQVFLIIVVNALDAMENKGTLTVESGRGDGNVWIRISDTGPGVPQEFLDKIFQPFFTTKINKGGTGLGLSIAHRIIVNHRGSLSVDSRPGQGASFTITLPLETR